MINRPDYLDWLKPDIDSEERWDYRTFDEYPPGDAPAEMIADFVKDAKEAEQALAEDLMKEEGLSREEAEAQACQWPIRDGAPMRIVRDYIGYMYEMQEAAKDGVDI